MQQLAKIAGVNVSTVSRALSGQTAIPLQTRQHIQQLALKHGYRPDPALNALCAYRRGVSANRYRPTIAIVATSAAWREHLAHRLYHDGARARADELGYQTEVFVVSPRLNCQRLVAILIARSIRGIMTLPVDDVSLRLDFPADQFLVIATGYKMRSPGLSRVSINHFAAMCEILQRLCGMGYKRPGLVLRPDAANDSREGISYVAKLWEGGYLAEREKYFPGLRIPVIEPTARAPLETWLRRYKPDVVISQNRNLPKLVGTRFPHLPVAYTMVDDDESLTGIHQNSVHVGRRAVDLLAADMYQLRAEGPVVPVTVLVDSRWQTGSTVLPVAASLT